MSVNLVLFSTTPFSANRTRNGNIPQFAIKKSQFEKITDGQADFFFKKVKPTFLEATGKQRERIFKQFLTLAATQIGKSLGIPKSWGQNRRYYLPFSVPANKTFTPVKVYNKSGKIKSVTGVSRTGKTINLSNSGLNYPFTGLSRTLPQGTVQKGLKKGIPELVIPSSTQFNSKSTTKSLGEILKRKIKQRGGVDINQLLGQSS